MTNNATYDQKVYHMSQFNIAQAKAHFSELVQKALRGEEVVIAKDNKPLLKLVPLQSPAAKRVPGSAKGQVLLIAPDFNETPSDFKDYA
jgi:prevent-host-death family protein